MEIHGLEDRNIPFAGGIGTKGVSNVDWPPVEATLEIFRRADACEKPVTLEAAAVRREDARCGHGRGISLITIADAGHQWPGAVAERPLVRLIFRLNAPSGALDATTTLWTFFAGHPLPQN